MELTFRFLDKESWSFYATINVLIPLCIFLFTGQKLDLEALIFMSLIAMMEGDLISKVIMTGFLNFLVYKPTTAWVIRSVIFVVSVILMNYVPQTDANPLYKLVMKSEIAVWIMRFIIFVWMCYIGYLIILSIGIDKLWTK
jgi:hypothetical protein